jgi:glutaredoxin
MINNDIQIEFRKFLYSFTINNISKWGDHISQVTVYSTKICPNCHTLKQILKNTRITYHEKDMTTPEAMTELTMNNVFTMSAPVLKIRDIFYTTNELIKDDAIDRQKVEEIINKLEGI